MTQMVVLQVSNADKFVGERLWCVLKLPNRKDCRFSATTKATLDHRSAGLLPHCDYSGAGHCKTRSADLVLPLPYS